MNSHLWCDENPIAMIKTRFQYQLSSNMCVRIIGPLLIGPVLLSLRFNGVTHSQFIENELPPLL